MTEQNIPEATEAERRLAYSWAKAVEANRDTWNYTIRAAARVILDAAYVPTMADMTEEERHECRWMQCEAGPRGRRGLIINTEGWHVYVVDKETGSYSNYSPDLVTACPDLPRMEWNGTGQEAETPAPAKIDDMIESADDPRLAALLPGSTLLDRDGDTVTKKDNEEWTGFGHHPNESSGNTFGPWQVVYIPKEVDQ